MFKRYAFLTLVVAAMTTMSCVEDEGNNIISEINEIEISGLEESYSCVTGADMLTITPEIKGSLSGTDESNLEYEWFLCNEKNVANDHAHEVIGRERNLNYEVTAAPANYLLYFSVKDKTTNLKWEVSTRFKIVSPFVRGFYLLGDKEDGNVGLDFISTIVDRDTFVVSDILNNDLELKGAKNIVFTGDYLNDNNTRLWTITESGAYRVEHSSALTSFNLLPDKSNPELLFFPTIEVEKPYEIVELYPHAYGSANTDMSKSTRFMVTENQVFCGSITSGEAYGNPINRYSASSTELYKPSKYVFYKPSTYITGYVFYDEDNKCFSRVNTNPAYGVTYTIKLSNNGEPFSWNQTEYEAVRDLVYGENGYGNAGRSYALMKDTNGDYFVYIFTVASYASVTANAARSIDLSVATDFTEADHYSFYSMQQIVLYAAGTKLYAYDYARNECKLVKDFEAEITHLAMDCCSNNDYSHIIVATYDETEKGVVYGYTIEDNQNAINVTPVEGEEWHTDLKVVKMEYRNSTL